MPSADGVGCDCSAEPGVPAALERVAARGRRLVRRPSWRRCRRRRGAGSARPAARWRRAGASSEIRGQRRDGARPYRATVSWAAGHAGRSPNARSRSRRTWSERRSSCQERAHTGCRRSPRCAAPPGRAPRRSAQPAAGGERRRPRCGRPRSWPAVPCPIRCASATSWATAPSASTVIVSPSGSHVVGHRAEQCRRSAVNQVVRTSSSSASCRGTPSSTASAVVRSDGRHQRRGGTPGSRARRPATVDRGDQAGQARAGSTSAPS